jgi:undecaprenyl-diphosphatase
VPLAVLVAIVVAASPFLTRPTRRLGGLLVISLAFAAMYLGTAYPIDLLGALVLGWGVGAAVHLIFGSPGGRPTTPQVEAALEELAVPARNVHLAAEQPRGRTLFLAEDDKGTLHVDVFGRDEADAQFIAKLGRSILYRDSGPRLTWSRLQQVEHEAYSVLLASAAGAPVPEVVVAGTAGPGAALLVERAPAGARLSELDAAAISDSALDALWRDVAILHGARVTHGALNAAHVVLTVDGPAIVDFDAASATGRPDRINRDVTELLISTAAMIGEVRAVAAAARSLGANGLQEILPYIQPAALTSECRASVGKRKDLKKLLDRVRELASTAAGTDPPPIQELHRVSGTNLMMAVGTLLAAAALLSQVGDPAELWATVKDASVWWLFVSIVLSLATNLPYAVALMGTVPTRLPLLRTTEVQLAMSFSNLAAPAVGGYAVQIRYLQKQGTDLASAVASGGLLSTVANVVAQIVLFLIAVFLSPSTIDFGEVDVDAIVKALGVIVLIAGVVIAVILGVPKLHKTVVPPVKQASATIWAALRNPSRIVLLLVGNFGASIGYGLCLLACVVAFGGHMSFWTLLAANIFVSTIASLIPIPGGGTAVSSVGLTGFLVAAGVPESIAVAAILTNQLVVSYLPALPGWFATNDLLHNGYI